jgi:hypothetical protein
LRIVAGAHPKEVQELCRHNWIVITMNVYRRPFESLHDDRPTDLARRFVKPVPGRMRDGDGTEVVELPR